MSHVYMNEEKTLPNLTRIKRYKIHSLGTELKNILK